MTRRTCPECDRDRVVSRREAQAVFTTGTVVSEALDAEPGLAYICTRCYNWTSER